MPMRIHNMILYTNMAEDSVVKAEFISNQWWRRFINYVGKHPVITVTSQIIYS